MEVSRGREGGGEDSGLEPYDASKSQYTLTTMVLRCGTSISCTENFLDQGCKTKLPLDFVSWTLTFKMRPLLPLTT